MKRKLPFYVAVGSKSGTALRYRSPELKDGDFGLQEEGGQYWRDAGHWGVDYEVKDGELLAKARRGPLKHLNGVALVRITKKKWEKDNAGYV